MNLINAITPIGTAYPPENYPDPVKTKRTIIVALQRVEATVQSESEKDDVMRDLDGLVAAFGDNVDAIGWVQKNWDEYKAGIDGRGFEVKRYRMALYWGAAGSEDEQVLVLQESESPETLTKAATDMIRTYHSHGYVTKHEPDKSTGIYMDTLTGNGSREQKQYCRLKVSVIRPANFTPAKEQRYPEPSDIERQKLHATMAVNQNRANPNL